jgi:formylglycine-generating enzyme
LSHVASWLRVTEFCMIGPTDNAGDAGDGSITWFFGQVRQGDDRALTPLCQRYFPRLMGLAAKVLSNRPQRAASAEDAVQEALVSFWRRAQSGEFADVLDRDHLWQLLAQFTVYKVHHQIRQEAAGKRGGGRVLDEAALDARALPLDELARSTDAVELDLLAAEQLGKPIELSPGEHELVIKRGDEVVWRRRFAVQLEGTNWEPTNIADQPPPSAGPQPAVAPFTAEQARQHQDAWAKHLGVPVEFTNSLGMKFRLIPPGTYRRGLSPEDVAALVALDPEIKPESLSGEQPQHVVRLTKPYWLGVHEVTVGQFRQFVDAASFVTRAEIMARIDPRQRTWKSVPWEQTDAHPVVNVNWNEAQAFAQWLSQWDAWDYRLPTEAEWEFACRAGTESLWCSGNDLDALARVANIADAAAEPRWKPKSPGSRFMSATDGHVEAAPVGSLAANPFGLHDTIGNVWEWCSDRFDDKHYGQFRENGAVDPTGPTGGDPRVRRGGSWLHGVQYAHAASRQSSFPDAFNPPYGFRLALSFDPKQARYPIEDRIVARMVLQHGGRIWTTDGQEVRGDPSLLRSTPLRIEQIALGSDGPPAGMTDDQLQQLLIHLASVSELQALQINKLNVTDAGLQYLFGLKKLRTVNLSDTAVSPAGLRALQDALPDCEIVPTPSTGLLNGRPSDDGFVSLFNGKDLTGWSVVGPAAWTVRDGAVIVDSRQMGYLVCEQLFDDFELTGEVYADARSNGGICVRVTDLPPGGNGLQRGGYEFQVAGSQGDTGRNYTGGLYTDVGQLATVRPPIVADGVWVKIRLRLEGTRLQGWVEDKQTFDVQGKPDRLIGRRLVLQSFAQGGEVGYRNLRIRENPRAAEP